MTHKRLPKSGQNIYFIQCVKNLFEFGIADSSDFFMITLQKHFPLYQDNDGRQCVHLNTLVDFIAKESTQERTRIRFHIKHSIDKYDSLKTDASGKPLVTVASVLKYIISQAHRYTSCRQIADDIEVYETNQSDKPMYDLYRRIAISSTDAPLQKSPFPTAVMDASRMPTLYTIYKDKFTAEQWKHICMFEYQYSQICHNQRFSLDDARRARFKFYTSYQNTKEVVNGMSFGNFTD